MTQIDETGLKAGIEAAIASDSVEAAAKNAITAYLASAKPAGEVGELIEESRKLADDLGFGHFSMSEAIAMIRRQATALEALTRQGEAEAVAHAYFLRTSDGKQFGGVQPWPPSDGDEIRAQEFGLTLVRLFEAHPPAQSGELERMREALDDVKSHLADWRKGCAIAKDHAEVSPPDIDDKSYWQHQINVIDRIAAALASASPKARTDEEAVTEMGWNALSVKKWKLANARITELEAQLAETVKALSAEAHARGLAEQQLAALKGQANES